MSARAAGQPATGDRARRHLDVLEEAAGPVAGLTVLDIGCGMGGLMRGLLKRGARPIGLDNQWRLLAQAEGLATVAGIGEALPIADRSLDGTVMVGSLHHVPPQNQRSALAEGARVVRRGGWAFIAEPVADGDYFGLVRMVDDETAVRAAAQDALAGAIADGLGLKAEGRYAVSVVHASAEVFLASLSAVDPDRQAALVRHEAALRAGFATAGEEVSGGRRFLVPFQWHLFAM